MAACNRVLRHDHSRKRQNGFDTVTAPKGGTEIVHDRCGGKVALSQRLGLK